MLIVNKHLLLLHASRYNGIMTLPRNTRTIDAQPVPPRGDPGAFLTTVATTVATAVATVMTTLHPIYIRRNGNLASRRSYGDLTQSNSDVTLSLLSPVVVEATKATNVLHVTIAKAQCCWMKI